MSHLDTSRLLNIDYRLPPYRGVIAAAARRLNCSSQNVSQRLRGGNPVVVGVVAELVAEREEKHRREIKVAEKALSRIGDA